MRFGVGGIEVVPVDRHSSTQRVSIDPNGQLVEASPLGDVDLYPQASRIFSQLDSENVFTGARNVFQNIEVRRLHVTSDSRHKDHIEAIECQHALDLVRQIVPRRYTIDGQPAAGMLAEELHRGPFGEAVGVCTYVHPTTFFLVARAKKNQQKTLFSHRWSTTRVAEDGTLCVDYNAVLAYLWTAVRELVLRNSALENTRTPAPQPVDDGPEHPRHHRRRRSRFEHPATRHERRRRRAHVDHGGALAAPGGVPVHVVEEACAHQAPSPRGLHPRCPLLTYMTAAYMVGRQGWGGEPCFRAEAASAGRRRHDGGRSVLGPCGGRLVKHTPSQGSHDTRDRFCSMAAAQEDNDPTNTTNDDDNVEGQQDPPPPPQQQQQPQQEPQQHLLRARLDGLLANSLEEEKGERRSGGLIDFSAVLDWCSSATQELFTPTNNDKGVIVTEWGVACLRALLPVLLENDERLPPAMCAWLREHLVPSLSAMTTNNQCHDLTFLLVRGLLNKLLVCSAPPPPTSRRPEEEEEEEEKAALPVLEEEEASHSNKRRRVSS